MNILIYLLSTVYMGIGFTGLLFHKMKPFFYFLLTVHLFIVNAALSPLIGQFVTLPLVVISITIIYWGCNRNIWEVIFSLTGYLFAVLLNHLATVPLTLLNIPMKDIQTEYPIPFLLTMCIGTICIQLPFKKYCLHPKLPFLHECPKKLQFIFLLQLLVCVILITVNFIYGEYTGYPIEVLSFNGIVVSIFTIFTLFLFYCLYQLLQENYELKLHQKEQEAMKDYTEKMECFYEEFRTFRHDYKNILSTLGYYIEEQNISQLQSYFQEKILPFGEALSSDKFAMGKLHQIEIPAIKSILYAKLLSALNKGIPITLEITDTLKNIGMDELDISRILGILLDNALEASVQTEDKLFSVTIVVTDTTVLFSIINSCPFIQVPLSKLSEKGYTSKKMHDGLGLYTVQNIVAALDNVSYIMQYDGLFRQTLEISDS